MSIELSKLEERINELESRLAFQDDTIDTLNDIVVQQNDKIKALIIVIDKLKEQMESGYIKDQSEESPPPHY